jgi:hypothetical protein
VPLLGQWPSLCLFWANGQVTPSSRRSNKFRAVTKVRCCGVQSVMSHKTHNLSLRGYPLVLCTVFV